MLHHGDGLHVARQEADLPGSNRHANRVDLRPCRGDIGQDGEWDSSSRLALHKVTIDLIKIIVESFIASQKVVAQPEEANLFIQAALAGGVENNVSAIVAWVSEGERHPAMACM